MFNFLCKALLRIRYSSPISPNQNPNIHQSLKFSSSNANSHSFTLSYLINSCGFSPAIAKSASKRVTLENPEKPDSVLAFFKNHGFSEPQMLRVIRRYPSFLLSNPEKTFLPKLVFLQSKGVSSPEIVKIITRDPYILRRSVNKHIIPTFDFLKSFLQSDEKTIASIKQYPHIVAGDPQIFLTHSIKVLRDIGVPDSGIFLFLRHQPRMFMMRPKRFLEILEDVKKMGFDPTQVKFIEAFHVRKAMNKSTCDKKLAAYKKWGWAEEDVLAAFRRYPWCMSLSEEKIALVMNFFVKELGWESLRVAKCPIVLGMSLEKRVIPRASVLQSLFEKGLCEKSFMTVAPFICTELKFLMKFVHPHPEEADQLLKIYKEKLDSGMKSKMLTLGT